MKYEFCETGVPHSEITRLSYFFLMHNQRISTPILHKKWKSCHVAKPSVDIQLVENSHGQP